MMYRNEELNGSTSLSLLYSYSRGIHNNLFRLDRGLVLSLFDTVFDSIEELGLSGSYWLVIPMQIWHIWSGLMRIWNCILRRIRISSVTKYIFEHITSRFSPIWINSLRFSTSILSTSLFIPALPHRLRPMSSNLFYNGTLQPERLRRSPLQESDVPFFATPQWYRVIPVVLYRPIPPTVR